MRTKLYCALFFSLFIYFSLSSQVVVNEINASSDKVELKNIGSGDVNIAGYYLCDWPEYDKIEDLVSDGCGTLLLGPGEIFTVSTAKYQYLEMTEKWAYTLIAVSGTSIPLLIMSNGDQQDIPDLPLPLMLVYGQQEILWLLSQIL